MQVRHVFLAGLASLLLGLSPATAATSGSLDPTFGSGGVAVPAPGGMTTLDVALQTDGKVVVAGYAGPSERHDFAVARYTAAGQPDTSFGGDGEVTTDLTPTTSSSSGSEEANAVLVQPDGKIVAVGARQPDIVGQAPRGFRFVRYLPNGQLDTTFSGDGKAVIAGTLLGPPLDQVYSAALQPDGKIVAVGTTACCASAGFVVVRVKANGALDGTFSGDGIAVYSGSGAFAARSVALQSDGRIIVGGEGGAGLQDAILIRLTTTGALDQSFGSSGAVIAHWNGAVFGFQDIDVMSDNRFVVPGYLATDGGADGVTARYTANGALDTTYGQDGVAGEATAGGSPDQVHNEEAVVQPDGKVIALGYIGTDLVISRYLANGGVDPAYGPTGNIIASRYAGPEAVLQGDGRLVARTPASAARFIAEGTAPPPPLMCGGQPVTIEGTDGADTIYAGNPWRDVVWAGAGNDVVSGLGPADIACAGDGNDRVVSFGGAGGKYLDGGPGVDTIDYRPATAATRVDLTAGTGTTAGVSGVDTLVSFETVYGSSYADTLLGSAAADTMLGLQGNDSIDGRGGNDVLYGMAGSDQLTGGAGTDIVGFTNAPGPVSANLAQGVASGEGSDSFVSVESLGGSPYADVLTGDDLANYLNGAGGDDQLNGLGGNDLLLGFAGVDALSGGAGTDRCDGGVNPTGTADTADASCETTVGVP